VGWIHNANAGIELTFGVVDRFSATAGIPVTVAGRDATYRDIAPATDGVRRQVWILEIDGTRAVITIASAAGASAPAIAEAEAIVASVRVEPAE
jgi:hypothetical protein